MKSLVDTLAPVAAGWTQSTSPPRMTRTPPMFDLTTEHHCTFVLGGANGAACAADGGGGDGGAPGWGGSTVQYDSNE